MIGNYKRFIELYKKSTENSSYTTRPTITPEYPSVESYDRQWFEYTYKTEALYYLLFAALALRTYYADHGQYPDKLEDLVPSYLKSIPNDPFVEKKPLIYKKTAKGYLLYSVGPDGVDDGGKPVFDSKYKPPTDQHLI